MKKSDLEYGNVVELRNGGKYVVYHCGSGKALISLITGEWVDLVDKYNEDLIDVNDIIEFDIMKVYKDYTCKELLWERKEKSKLTEDEKAILRNLPKRYEWIVRDENGLIYLFTNKPFKSLTRWVGYDLIVFPFEHIFEFIKWEDEEPYSIEELLKEE